MTNQNIGVIVSSTRPTRIGPNVAAWIASQAPADVIAEIVDLAELNLPFLQDVAMPASGEYDQPTTRQWAEKVSGYTGLIIAVAEYNAGYTAPLKNAIDTLFAEWRDKPVGLVGYGFGGAARAIEQLKPVLRNVKALPVEGPKLVFNKHLSIEGDVLDGDVAEAVRNTYTDVLEAASELV